MGDAERPPSSLASKIRGGCHSYTSTAGHRLNPTVRTRFLPFSLVVVTLGACTGDDSAAPDAGRDACGTIPDWVYSYSVQVNATGR